MVSPFAAAMTFGLRLQRLRGWRGRSGMGTMPLVDRQNAPRNRAEDGAYGRFVGHLSAGHLPFACGANSQRT
jgi:hypothetical protein